MMWCRPASFFRRAAWPPADAFCIIWREALAGFAQRGAARGLSGGGYAGAARLQDGAKYLRIFWARRCRCAPRSSTLGQLSAHAGRSELLRWLSGFKIAADDRHFWCTASRSRSIVSRRDHALSLAGYRAGYQQSFDLHLYTRSRSFTRRDLAKAGISVRWNPSTNIGCGARGPSARVPISRGEIGLRVSA